MDLSSLKNRYDIVGNDPKLLLALNKAQQVAPTDLSILITGENGVGKDVFSHIIHDLSNRRHGKMISVNCGAIPEGTIESELFGHLKGAFTGAEKDRKGYFEEANGGTIFLDEVGELPLSMQVKLLRVLENGEIIPVGSSKSVKVDVRIVAATNINIAEAIRKGRFREDLYYRLNQISIYVPPLRERPSDIALLFRKFSSDVAEKYSMEPIFLTDDAKAYLCAYPWYGNIRELKNMTEQIAVVEEKRTITREILQNYLSYVPDEKMPALVGGFSDAAPNAISDRELLLKALTMGQMINEMRGEINDLRYAVSQLASQLSTSVPQQGFQVESQKSKALDLRSSTFESQSSSSAHPPLSIHSPAAIDAADDEEFQDSEVIEDEPLALNERERNAIIHSLDRHKGNRRKTSEELGISERTLYRKIKEYGL